MKHEIVVRRYHHSTTARFVVRIPGPAGKPVRRFFREKAEAEQFARGINSQIRDFGERAMQLDEKARLMAVQCIEALRPHGKTLSDATLFFVAHLNAQTNRETPALSNVPKDESGRFTMSSLAKHWLETTTIHLKQSSQEGMRFSWKGWEPFIGDVEPSAVTHQHLEAWMTKRAPSLSWSSYTKERMLLSRLLGYAAKRGWVKKGELAEFIPKRKQPRPGIFILSREQMASLIQTIRSTSERSADAANLMELLACSGMRVSEAVALKWSDIDWKNGTFTVTGGAEGTKNHECRTVPIFPALRAFLERWAADQGGIDCIAPSRRVVTIASAKTAINSARKKLGLPNFGHHMARHCFVTNAIENGVDFKAIAGWVGHKDGGVLVAKTYGHLRQEHSHAMAARMVAPVCPNAPSAPVAQ